MLRLAKRWGYLRDVPEIEMAKEPEGRVRYLTAAEAVRLLAACATSKNPWLTEIVTVALNTGMRKGEILGLTWDRVDFSRGVIQLELTKNGKRREIPMNAAVDGVLVARCQARPAGDGYVFPKADGGFWGRMQVAFDSLRPGHD